MVYKENQQNATQINHTSHIIDSTMTLETRPTLFMYKYC